jgi:hypothetical protein
MDTFDRANGSSPRTIVRGLRAAMFLAGAGLPLAAAAQTTIHVAPCGNDTWTGSNAVCAAPDGPKRTIQTAISAAAGGDTVLVADGSYTGPGNRDLDFGGRQIILRSQNGAATCIIDVAASAADPHRALHFHNGETGAAVVEGLTIRSGYAGRGGAVLCEGGSSPLIRACTFEGNTGAAFALFEDGGGAVYILDSSPEFVNCEFLSNSTPGRGGGAYVQGAGSSVTLTDCRFVQNAAGVGQVGTGGGGAFFANAGAIVEFRNCEVRDSTAAAAGGGVFVNDGVTATFIGCLFEQNQTPSDFVAGGLQVRLNSHADIMDCVFRANRSAGAGGLNFGQGSTGIVTNCTFSENHVAVAGAAAAVRNNNAQATFIGCLFQDNTSDIWDGGLLVEVNCVATVINCTFRGNTAALDSGAIAAWQGSQVDVVNTLIVGNTVTGTGGAVHAAGVNMNAHVRLTNCTLFGNEASVGGGIRIDSFGTAQVLNSILWNNTPAEIVELAPGGAVVTHSNIHGGWPGVGNIKADPLFGNIAALDFSLSPGSLCIDAGENTAVPAGIITDLAGDARFAGAGLAPGCGRVDMGAYEFQGGACYANCDCSTTAPILNVADFSCFLQKFAAGDPYANCDGSTVHPVLNVADFGCFLQKFAAGCP